MPTSVRWTEEEINTLRELAKEYCMSDVADKLHRPQTSVRVKAKQLNIVFAIYANTWTDEKDATLRTLWNTSSVEDIATSLQQSRSGVYSRAKFLELPEHSTDKVVKPNTTIRLCYKCKRPNDRPDPAIKCSSCYVGKPKPKGTGWSSRRCLNCNSGYTGKTRDYCTRDCKFEAATKQRMLVLGNAHTYKVCKRCENSLPIHKFNLDPTRKDKVHPYCRGCQKLTKGLVADTARNRRLLNFYGITLEEYNILLVAQDGHCAMCPAIPLPEKNLAVDHDHISGAVRGLLCLTCNKYKLGQLTLSDIDNIYNYLHNPPADKVFGQTRYVPVGMEKPKKKRRRKSVK